MAFNLTQLIPGVGHEFSHVATAAIVTGGLTVASVAARYKLASSDKPYLPEGRVSLKGVVEAITEFMNNLVVSVMGEHGRKFGPMFAAIFTFILINNLVGILPGMTPATENINTSFAMGIFVFVMYNVMGFKENGFGYLKHFFGPIWWLGWFIFVLEVISHIVRPFSLGLRLANVLMGDHTVVTVFLNLSPYLVPIPFYILGLLVAFVQAFVFTLLSIVYLSLATAHDH